MWNVYSIHFPSLTQFYIVNCLKFSWYARPFGTWLFSHLEVIFFVCHYTDRFVIIFITIEAVSIMRITRIAESGPETSCITYKRQMSGSVQHNPGIMNRPLSHDFRESLFLFSQTADMEVAFWTWGDRKDSTIKCVAQKTCSTHNPKNKLHLYLERLQRPS